MRSTVLRYVLRRSTSNVDTIFAAAAPGDVNPELVDASKQLQQTHDYEEQAAAFARMVAAADGAELQADGAECTTAMAGPLRAICRQTMADIENLIGAHGLGLKAGSTSLPAPVASNTIKINGWTFSKDISAEP